MAFKTTKRGKEFWQAKIQVNRKIRTKKCETKKEAKTWESEMRANTEWAYPKAETQTLSALSWASRYLAAMLDRGIAKSTYEEKNAAFRVLFAEESPVKENSPVEAITVGVADEILRARMRLGSGYAANKDRKNLAAAWRWGAKYLGLPKDNPFLEVERFPEERRPRYVPPVEDFWAVYSATTTQLDKVMLLMFLDTAARKSEVFNLRWTDVDMGAGRILLRTRKRRGGNLEGDWIPMSKRLMKMMKEHMTLAQGEYVFMWFDARGLSHPYTHRMHWMRTLCKRAKVPPFDLHSIRHLSATMQVQSGLSLNEVQGVLRHRSATTTNRYLHQLTGVQVALDRVFREEDIPA